MRNVMPQHGAMGAALETRLFTLLGRCQLFGAFFARDLELALGIETTTSTTLPARWN